MTADIRHLKMIEQRLLWLSHWMIHHANHVRPKADGIKVGGHQASSASMVSIMTALYFSALRPEDRVAVKPHASPVFHAIQYLMGNQTREKLETFRGFGGAQSYPSRTKDTDDVDFSTGSVGLGVAITSFASLVRDYIAAKPWGSGMPEGRMVALVGDAELDEGNVYETLQEGWKNDLRNCWWIIDYNRQSLDGVVREGLFSRIEKIFNAFGWDVVRVKHGALQRAAFAEPGGDKLRDWIDACPNQEYSALTFMGGSVWRKRLMDDLGDQGDVTALLEQRSDAELAALMENLGGNCVETMAEVFAGIDHDRPTCFLAYTIKGWGTPIAGHKDNHGGLMNRSQFADWQAHMGVSGIYRNACPGITEIRVRELAKPASATSLFRHAAILLLSREDPQTIWWSPKIHTSPSWLTMGSPCAATSSRLSAGSSSPTSSPPNVIASISGSSKPGNSKSPSNSISSFISMRSSSSSQQPVSWSLFSESLRRRTLRVGRSSTIMHGTCSAPSRRAAASRACPSMTWYLPSIRIGMRLPKRAMDCATAFSCFSHALRTRRGACSILPMSIHTTSIGGKGSFLP